MRYVVNFTYAPHLNAPSGNDNEGVGQLVVDVKHNERPFNVAVREIERQGYKSPCVTDLFEVFT